MGFTRRELIRLGAAAGLAFGGTAAWTQTPRLISRTIPSSGETIPPVGIGTNRYGVGDSEAARAPLRETLRLFDELGGKVIDTAAEYGSSERVIGELTAELGIREELLLATKVDRAGREQGIERMERSFAQLGVPQIDLMQVHNLLGFENHVPVLRDWKAAGRIRYIGATTSRDYQHGEIERVIRSEPIDFVQVNYSLENRRAAERVLPAAADRGVAVLVNVPFGQGSLFTAVRGEPLPDWAAEFDCESWAQFFLKYIISHPAVTCAIPGTRQRAHLLDNFGAARGRLPDAELRRRQEQYFDGV